MMKKIFLLAIILSISLLCCSCLKPATQQTEGESTDTTNSVQTTDATDTTEGTEPVGSADTAEPDEDDVATFVEDNFGFDEDDGYEFKEQVGGEPVIEYGVYEEDGEGESYTPDDPDAPATHDPIPAPAPAPDPDPTEPTTDEQDEPQPDPQPVVPKDAYAAAIAAIEDYTAEVKFVCEVELSDGSVTRYIYKYSVNKSGEDYTATYMDKGVEKEVVFRTADGAMTVDGAERNATLDDFYRFCSMVEPLPLSLYYYEHSSAGTDYTARLNGSDYRSLLLNTSSLFSGFDVMEGVEMGSLYYSGHTDAEGVYTASKLAYDMSLVDKILGDMLFRVSVEVSYVY